MAGLGPTDLLKLGGARPGVVGGAKVLADADGFRRVTYLELFIGTKIPDPGIEVAKYLRPSTSPLFFPRRACSGPSSMPANRPGLPATVPRYLTVPYMPPGTLTVSPTLMSSMAAIIFFLFGLPPNSTLVASERHSLLLNRCRKDVTANGKANKRGVGRREREREIGVGNEEVDTVSKRKAGGEVVQEETR